MTPGNVIDGADIRQVWVGLGGEPLRRNRGCAFWRGSTSFSVSISPDKDAFFDHGPHEGGGILRLVQVARNCDKAGALEWLADFHGVSLDNRPLSIDHRREWQRKRRAAEKKASDLLGWREALLREIRQRRDDIWERVLVAERFGRQFVNEAGRDDSWDFCFRWLAEEPEGERLDRWVGGIEAMGPAELVALRRRMAQEGKAA